MIELHGVRVTRAGHTVLDGLDVHVERGQVVAILGPPGSGKTTALHVLLGLVRPDEGGARLGGRPVRRPMTASGAVGAALDGSVHPALTVRRHLRVAAAAVGAPAGRVTEVLRTVGVSQSADTTGSDLAPPVRKRVALAGALLTRPEILVLDEPLDGLDRRGAVWLRSFLRDYADSGGTVLLTSAALGDVEDAADHLVLVDRGRTLATGGAELLYEDRLEDFYVQVTGSSSPCLTSHPG